MKKRIARELVGLGLNIKNGLFLLVYRKSVLEKYYLSIDQILLFALFYTLVTFIGSFFLSLPMPEMSFFGMASVAVQLFFIILLVYTVTVLQNKSECMLQVTLVVFSVWPWFYLMWLLVGGGENFSIWTFYGKKKYLYIIYNLWMMSVITYAISWIVGLKGRNVVVCLVFYTVILAVPLHYSSVGKFWHLSYEYDNDYKKYASVNQENTYYKQFDFVEELKTNSLTERPGVTDIYFVGFGSYASQDVFMKEVQYAKKLFDDKFDTEGRSVALINNLNTLDKYPLATKNNLDLVLYHFSKLANTNEDVLFLYLTSHGSSKHELSVDLMPLTLNTINPASLKKSLDVSGIKYRVLLVSACYSGGFIEPLKDENTLIFTASASDRQSFGCGHNNEFTYFGKAVFEEQLRTNYNFIDAFDKAIISITKREINEKRKPSRPQLYVGKNIRVKLGILTKELEKFNVSNNQAK